MQYGICNLSIVPLRSEPSESSEILTQVLYGEHFKVLEQRIKWARIRIAFDNSEGWIDTKQFLEITEEKYREFDTQDPVLSADLIDYISDREQNLMPVPLGSVLNFVPFLQHSHDGKRVTGRKSKKELVNTAFLYLNAPFLTGGKTPFGIDSGGFVQMVYRLNGYELKRNATEQARLGESLSFIEESEPGDLAFFDDKEGAINHVGIILYDNYIIHAYGKVRIDRIDHTGIFNTELRTYTHLLRVIKKMI